LARILVIDDEDIILDIMRRVLEECGHEIITAKNGEEGLRLYRQEVPDLVITDINMPKKDGFEVIQELKADFPDVKIIALTGDEANISGAQKRGANLAFLKPFDFVDLLDAVQDLLEN